MKLKNEDIVQIISTIWQSLLGIERVSETELPVTVSGSMASCVQITGEWQGAVVLGCGEAFAARAATAMFETQDQDRNRTDMQDAVAELTNMIGGNLKGLLDLPQACQLSLPSVVAGADFTTRVPGSRLINRIALVCDGDVIVVSVLEKLPVAKAA
jgi:chemotaxis protein CheX